MLGGSLGYNHGKAIGSYEGTRLGSTDGKVLVTILGNINRITVRIDIRTELGFLDVFFYGSNGGKLEGILLRDS